MTELLRPTELPERGMPIALAISQGGARHSVHGQVRTVSPRVMIVHLTSEADLDGVVQLEWGSSRGLAVLGGTARTIADRTARILLADGDVEYLQRRRFPRAHVRLPISLTAMHELRDGQTLDLGEGGLRCRVIGRGAPRGALVTSMVDTGDGTPIEALGVVRRALELGAEVELSVQFTDLAPGHADRIRREVFLEQIRRRIGG